MKKIFTNLFLLATLFLASTNLTAQTYNNGTWYSLYDATEEYKNTDKTFSVFAPTTESLSFQWKKTGWFIGHPIYKLDISESSDGSNYTKIHRIESGSGTQQNSYVSITTAVSKNITHLKFQHDGGSLDRFYKDIKIPLKQHILIAAGSFGKTSESKIFENVTIGGTSKVQTVKLRSFLTNGDIKITSGNPAFRIGSADNTQGQTFAVGKNACASTNGKTGTNAGGETLGDINLYDINIYFVPTAEGEHSGTITISDGTSSATISVSGVGVKKAQSIIWNIADADTKLPLNKIVENAARATSGLPITYTSSDETIIKIINNGTAFQAIKAGTATITATQAGDNNEWNAATPDSKEFTVTAKQIQSIVWEGGNLTRLKTGSEPITLSAKVQLTVNAETGEKVDSDERTARLTYASANNNVVSVSDGNVLTIVGEGETTLTVNVPGDEFYEAASVVIPVKVRQPSAGCEDILLVDQPAEISFFEMNTGEIIKNAIAINTAAGVPDKLTFQHKGEYWNLVINYYSGTIKAQQSTDGGNNWSDIAGSEIKPTVGQYNTLTVQLDRRATHIRFVRPSGGQGYHYVSGIVVTPAQYLETSLSSINETAIVGDIITKDIVINYANVKDEVLIAHNEDVNTVSISETGLGNDCGDFGKHTLKVTITPAEVGTITDNIVISDAVSKMNVTIPVTVDVRRNTQTILWNNADAEILTTADITFDAEAKTNITYKSSNTQVADVDSNKLIIKTEGEVIITAKAEQDNKYEAATLTKKYIISKATPAIVSLPTVEAITYGATLEAATLNGGETDTEGTWQWNADLTQVLNAGTHELAVQFIPTNTAWYNTLDSKVTITVNKANQTINWDFTTTEMTVDEVLTLSATALAGKVTFALTGDAATLEGNTLTAVKAGKVTITASQAGNENYNAAEEVAHTITIHKATPTVTAWPTLNDVVYGATYSEALQLVGGEASVEGAFSITNMPADLAQVPAVGKYTFGIVFTPAKSESYNEVSDSVTLQVTKQLQTIAWDFADQELLIGNTLTLSATAPAGEVSFAIQPAEGVASLEGNTLTALAAGTVTITATAPENENYEAASVSYTVTVIKHTPEIITLPTVAPLGHGTALTDDMLNGGESNIKGTWSFVNPTQSLNMGNNEVAIRFTPTNTDLYNTIDATITIVVEKAETIIYWELESNILDLNDEIFLYAETANGDVITTFEITGPQGILQYDSEFMSLTAIGYGTTEVTAYYPETETHKAAELSYEITVFDPNSETTGITNTTITGKDTEKVFINGQLFIIRNNQWYDTTGKLVK
ncbi:MAG: hypothetical protein IJV81_04225 [Paludibacteraceae bacterium]|nr:hypothetical protein [Paludibacteraceae bacterium]